MIMVFCNQGPFHWGDSIHSLGDDSSITGYNIFLKELHHNPGHHQQNTACLFSLLGSLEPSKHNMQICKNPGGM